MKMLFRDEERTYEIEINEKEVVVCDRFEGERFSMSRYGFIRFLDWMVEEVRPAKIKGTESQNHDLWDISGTDKK